MRSIALVVNSFPKLSETFIYSKVRFLAENGFKVTVITHTDKNDGKMFPINDIANIEIINSTVSSSKIHAAFKLIITLLSNPIEIWKNYKQIKSKYKYKKEIIRLLLLYIPFSKKYDIIHFAFSGLAIAYLPLLPVLKKKSILYTSCRGTAELIRPIVDNQRKQELIKLFSIIDRVHCVSSDIMHVVCQKFELHPSKAFVNRPAINHEVFQEKKSEKFRSKKSINIISVGRLHWVKAIEILLQGLNILCQRGVDATLYIVGDGPEKEKLIFIAHSLNIEKKVIFMGSQSQERVFQLLNTADIYVHSSLSEGISNSVMEAMAMGLPIVCTDVGGMSELISNNEDGILIQPLEPNEMADQLYHLCQDDILRKKMGQNARKKIIKDFTLERQCKIFLQEYTQALVK